MNNLIKISILSLFFIISGSIYSQDYYDMPIDEATGKIHYQQIEKTEGTKSELYRRAQKWLHSFFRNASSVIKRLDEDSGMIEGRRQLKVNTTDKKGRIQESGTIKYTFIIEIKEGKYRVRLFDFKEANNSGKPIESWFEDTDPKAKEIHAQIFKQIDADVKKLLASLKKGMMPTEIKTEEW